MIECRTKGIPMREGTRVDADGHHCFALDETKHDPLGVALRLMAAAGYVEPAVDKRFEAMKRMTPQELARFDVAYADRLDREKAARK